MSLNSFFVSMKPFFNFEKCSCLFAQADAIGGCWLIRLIVGMRDPRMPRCVARAIAMLKVDFIKFEVSELDFNDFFAMPSASFCSCLHFQALNHMKP